MKYLGLAGLAGVCLASSAAFATDLFESAPPPMDAPPVAQQELGSNWYIRGDVGYGEVQQASVVPQAGLIPQPYDAGFFDNNGNYNQLYSQAGKPFQVNDVPVGGPSSPAPITRGNVQHTSTAVFDIGFGYRVNDWLRVDATYNFFRGPGYGVSSTITCPQTAVAVSNTIVGPTGTATGTVPAGYQWDTNTCLGQLNMQQYNHLGLASAYLDLGHWWGVSPYIGAGVGMNVNIVNGSVKYNSTATGQTYAGPQVTGSAPAYWVIQSGSNGAYPIYAPVQGSNGRAPNIPIGPQNWNRQISQTKYTIAGQLMAGVGIPISQSATLDLGYRVLTTDISGGVKGLFQSVNLGVRYNLN